VNGLSALTVLQFTGQFLTQKSIIEMEHPPSYLDLAPNDFWLLLKIKSVLYGRKFEGTENMHKNVTALKAVPQQQFQKCFQRWQHRLAKCIASEGELL
jgi:hypothetical protein